MCGADGEVAKVGHCRITRLQPLPASARPVDTHSMPKSMLLIERQVTLHSVGICSTIRLQEYQHAP